MPAEQRGSVYRVKGGYGVRWREGVDAKGKERRRRYCPRPPFPTKTAARQWYAQNVAPRLHPEAPSGDEKFQEFVELYLTAHAAKVDPRTIRTLRERLGARVPGDRPEYGAAARGHGGSRLRTYRDGDRDVRRHAPPGSRARRGEDLRLGGDAPACVSIRTRFRGAIAGAGDGGRVGLHRAQSCSHPRAGVDAGVPSPSDAPRSCPFTRAEIDRLAVELGYEPEADRESSYGVAVRLR